MTDNYDQMAAESLSEEEEIQAIAEAAHRRRKANKLVDQWGAAEEAAKHPLPEGIGLTEFLAQEDETPSNSSKGCGTGAHPSYSPPNTKPAKQHCETTRSSP
jgi:hypothetical protein